MSKINQILTEWKPGDLHSLSWLKDKGIAQNLAYQYHKNGSLKKLGPGIYARSNEQLNWMGGVRLLQEELGKKIHVSGRAAFELRGRGHFIPMSPRPTIYLTTYEKEKIPKWFFGLNFDCQFAFTSSSLFKEEIMLSEYESYSGFKLKISSDELAILEFIESLDLRYSFETIENYMNSLTTLRAKVLQELLEDCSSIKVKRVFLYLSEKLNHQYFKKLEIEKINLGSGKRLIIENGQFDKKYQITVPRNYGDNPF